MKSTITIFFILLLAISGFCNLYDNKDPIAKNAMTPWSHEMVMPDTCEWLKSNAKWYYTPWNMIPSDDVFRVETVGLSVVENRICSILATFENGELIEESELTVYYDAELEHVYFYEDDSWKLLYDFSMDWAVGDTLEYYLPQNMAYYDISSSSGEFSVSSSAYKIINMAEEWIVIGASNVRVIHTQAIPNEDDECFEMGSIISGIGSKQGLLGRSCTQLLAGFSEYFRCHTRDDFLYSEVEECVPSQNMWFGEIGSEWHHCLLVELGDPYTVDINTQVVDTSIQDGVPISTIQGDFFAHTVNPEIDKVDIINYGDKVYYSFGDENHLLYDFGVSLWDTVTLRFPTELEPLWFEDNPTTSEYFKIVIDSFSVFTLESESLKRVHFRTIIETDENTNHVWAPTYLGDFYTEKLGYENFILPYIVTGYDENNAICSLKEFETPDLFYENEDSFCLTVSTEEIDPKNSLSVFPNPARNTIRLDIDKDGLINGEILNTSGLKVQSFNTREIDISQLPIGLYFIKLIDDDHIIHSGHFVKG